MQRNKNHHRVVITGLGIVSSLGIGAYEFWKNLISGKSGISAIESFDVSHFCILKGGEIKNFKLPQFLVKNRSIRPGRASQLAISAMQLAFEDGNLKKEDISRSGVLLGTTMGETQILEKLNREWVLEGEDKIERNLISAYSSNNLSVNPAIYFGLTAFNAVMPTACSSANYATGYGFDLISSGKQEVMVCGGVDAFSKVAFIGFNRLFAMAPEKCQPFDKNRKGMMLGEGAAILILESLRHAIKRKAHIYAEILGYGLSCDAHHMTQPSEDGVTRCIEKAIIVSAIDKEDVDYISAHGTGTPQNDKVECAALRKVFGGRLKRIPCSSIKSMLGHTMGAAAAMETAACCLSIRDGIVPPTINFETADIECDIDCVPNEARRLCLKVALNNSSAFGGNNACLVLKAYEN